ncbi:MAG: hypothetical protein KKD77_20665, partial [Gammaproteobacteria bacterium]|nr:hypothetical protein [Gammaproteobacteria bacterium]
MSESWTKPIPFVGGIVEAVGSVKTYGAAKRLAAGHPLKGDTKRVKDAMARMERQKRLNEELTGLPQIGYTAGRILTELPAYVGEFAATGPFYGGAKAAVERGALKIGGEASKRGVGKALTAVASRGAGGVAQGLALGTLSGKSLGGTAERMAGGDDFIPALYKAYGDMTIEVLSERSGGVPGKLLNKIPMPQRITALKAAVAKAWMGKTGGSVNDFLRKTANATQWHGVLGEMFEERAGEVGRAAAGIEPYQAPSLEQLAAEALSFSVPGIAAAGLRRMDKPLPVQPRKLLAAPEGEVIAPEPTEARFKPEGEIYEGEFAPLRLQGPLERPGLPAPPLVTEGGTFVGYPGGETVREPQRRVSVFNEEQDIAHAQELERLARLRQYRALPEPPDPLTAPPGGQFLGTEGGPRWTDRPPNIPRAQAEALIREGLAGPGVLTPEQMQRARPTERLALPEPPVPYVPPVRIKPKIEEQASPEVSELEARQKARDLGIEYVMSYPYTGEGGGMVARYQDPESGTVDVLPGEDVGEKVAGARAEIGEMLAGEEQAAEPIDQEAGWDKYYTPQKMPDGTWRIKDKRTTGQNLEQARPFNKREDAVSSIEKNWPLWEKLRLEEASKSESIEQERADLENALRKTRVGRYVKNKDVLLAEEGALPTLGQTGQRVVYGEVQDKIPLNPALALGLPESKGIYAVHIGDVDYWRGRLEKDYGRDPQESTVIEIRITPEDMIAKDIQYMTDPETGEKADSGILLTTRKFLRRGVDFRVEGEAWAKEEQAAEPIGAGEVMERDTEAQGRLQGGEPQGAEPGGAVPEQGAGGEAAPAGRVLQEEEVKQEAEERKVTIESIVAAARRPKNKVVEKYLLKGSDGEWHGGLGFPLGVEWTGEKSEPYYVFESSEGTTYGERYKTREKANQAQIRSQESRDAEFRDHLSSLSPEELQKKADFWLKEKRSKVEKIKKL